MLNEIEYLKYKILYKEKEIKEKELECINKEKNIEKMKIEKDFEVKRNNEIFKNEKKIQEINFNKKYDILTTNYKKEELNLKNRIEELENDQKKISLDLAMKREILMNEENCNELVLLLENHKYSNLYEQLSYEKNKEDEIKKLYKEKGKKLQEDTFKQIEKCIKELPQDIEKINKYFYENG